MQMLYDSEAFVVVHIDAHEHEDNPHNVGKQPRHGFEIVDKRSNLELYLDGKWAEAFQMQINMWQVDVPTQEEVEEILEGYTQLAQNPLMMH